MIKASLCSHCQQSDPLVRTKRSSIHPPARRHRRMRTLPAADKVKAVYKEAADIADRSPRASCALLRLAATNAARVSR